MKIVRHLKFRSEETGWIVSPSYHTYYTDQFMVSNTHRPPSLPPSLFQTKKDLFVKDEIDQKEEQIKKAAEEAKALRLDLDSLPSQPINHEPKSLFEEKENKCKPFVDAAVKYVKENFDTLASNLPNIERQIKQLIPIKASVVQTWGYAALDQESQLATNIAGIVRSFSEIRATELMEKVLTLAKSIPSQNFLTKLIGSKKEKSALEYKPQLVILQTQLEELIPIYNESIRETSVSETRLMIQLASLIAVREVVGFSNDDSLEKVIVDRRLILQQAATQAKFARTQIEQMLELINQQLSKLKTLLTITLPAFELALAQQHK